jgi:hypothetical protein
MDRATEDRIQSQVSEAIKRGDVDEFRRLVKENPKWPSTDDALSYPQTHRQPGVVSYHQKSTSTQRSDQDIERARRDTRRGRGLLPEFAQTVDWQEVLARRRRAQLTGLFMVRRQDGEAGTFPANA